MNVNDQRRPGAVWLALLVAMMMLVRSECGAQSAEAVPRAGRDTSDDLVTSIAEKYLRLPLKLGANPDMDSMTDNSHLIHAIHQEAAKEMGLKLKDYMPMRELLQNTYQISAAQLKDGDLFVLNDGLAALIYNFQAPDKFRLIYTSAKRHQVISISSDEPAFKTYWLKNLSGYFRLNEDLYESVDF